MLTTREMAAATGKPEPFFELCIDAGYLQPAIHASDAAAFETFWQSVKGCKRLTKPETVREMVGTADLEPARAKALSRDICAALEGEGPLAERQILEHDVPDEEPETEFASSTIHSEATETGGDNDPEGDDTGAAEGGDSDPEGDDTGAAEGGDPQE